MLIGDVREEHNNMNELQECWSFAWKGTKKHRYTTDRWSDIKNCRKLKNSTASANALLTGKKQLDKTKKYKLIAVDLDNKDNWKEVLNTYATLHLPKTLTVQTPSNGIHLFFWVYKGIPVQNINDNRHCKNFELKGDNSNITAPGSVFSCGATYKIIRDMPIAKLTPLKAYLLCKYKPTPRPRRFEVTPCDISPDTVEEWARCVDPRARYVRDKGWQLRCPYHEDKRASAIIFLSGYFYCSGCGRKEFIIKK